MCCCWWHCSSSGGLHSRTRAALPRLAHPQAHLTGGACSLPEKQQLCELVDALTELVSDSNHKVSQASLQSLAVLVKAEAETVQPFANVIVPLVVRGTAMGVCCAGDAGGRSCDAPAVPRGWGAHRR